MKSDIIIHLAATLLATSVSAAEWKPWTSRADVKPEHLRKLADGNETTVFGVPAGQDFGLETAAPTRINRLVVRYAALHGQFLQPKPQGATLEVWRDDRWQRVTADARIDYARWRDLAPLQACGSVEWTYRFAPVETTRIRIAVKDCDLARRWCGHLNYRGVVVRELAAKFEPERDDASPPSGKVVEAARPVLPTRPVSPDGECLTDAEYRPSVSQRGDAVEIGWPRRRMVNALQLRLRDEAAAVKLMDAEPQWWDGVKFRRAEKLVRTQPAPEAVTLQSPQVATARPSLSHTLQSLRQVTLRFQPVATTRLRLPTAGVSVESAEAWLDKEGRAFLSAAKDDPADVLGHAALAAGEPDLGRVGGVMLPTSFLKGFTGRPDDIEETMLNWNGALILRTGEGAERQHLYDRFVVFVLDDRAVGESPEEITRSLMDGWMPGLNYDLNRRGLSARMTVFTTAPTDVIYADRVHWEFQAARGARGPVQLDVVLGKRLTMYAYYTKVQEGEGHPCIFAPLEAGYRLDSDGQTVRDGEGGVALWSSIRGQWGGTVAEPRLKVSVPLDKNGKAQLDLVVPHVGVKPGDLRAPASYSRSLQLFREHWTKEVSGATQFIMPEPAVNAAARNALCQCLIIPDAGTPHYGAYWYEWCIGLEEWWPTIALAQFGRSREAKTHAAAIVGMSLNDPSHHFAYRNGLAGMGAAEVALLTGDREWYRGLLGNLKARADWTIASTQNDNRGTPYAGLIRKLAYGGDVASPAHSLYSNAACWRGLRDTGLMLQSLGEAVTAERYLRSAGTFRSRILEFWGAQVDRQTTPPFVPHAFDIGARDAGKEKRDYFAPKYQEREQAYPNLNKNPLGNYWNLFMPMVLELDVFPPGRPENGWIRDYAEQHGGVAAGLTRFRDGLDWHYGAGYIKSLLRSGQREKFLLSFYSTLAHGAADEARTSPEDCSIWPARTSNEGARAEYEVARWNWWSGWDEALSASPGVVLQLLRMMLLDEGRDADGDDGSLVLLSGVPRRWLEHGKEIRIENAPTHYGPVSLRAASRVRAGRIEMNLRLQPRGDLKKIVLKLFHPERRPLRAAQLNGRDLRPADAETLVFAPEARREIQVVALF